MTTHIIESYYIDINIESYILLNENHGSISNSTKILSILMMK